MNPGGRLLVRFLAVVLWGGTVYGSPPSPSVPSSIVVRWLENQDVQAASAIGEIDTIDLAFIDPSHVVIGALFQSPPDHSARHDFSETIKRNAIIAVIDAVSGQVVTTKTWHDMPGQPAFGDGLTLRATTSGFCLIGLGDKLYLLSPTLKQMAERSLPLNRTQRNGHPFQDSWSLEVAPSGQLALLVRSTPDYAVENHWIDLKTLKDKSVSQGPKYSLVAISDDDSVVFNDNSGDDVVQIRRQGAFASELCPTCSGAVRASFGSNLIFLSTKPAASYVVTNTAGKVLVRASHGSKPEFINRVAGAANSNRAAFLYGRPMENFIHLTVADVDAKQEIWQEEVGSGPEKLGNVGVQFTTPRLALSPDGHKLAIFSRSTLTLLNLP
jgi:hypothetical protein